MEIENGPIEGSVTVGALTKCGGGNEHMCVFTDYIEVPDVSVVIGLLYSPGPTIVIPAT